MAVDPVSERSPLRRRFPVLRFLEISSLALSPASVIIACLALLVLDATTWVSSPIEEPVAQVLVMRKDQRPVMVESAAIPTSSIAAVSRDISIEVLPLTAPWSTVVEPAIKVVRSETDLFLRLQDLIRAGIAITVWSLVGVILCRRAAFLFAGNDRYTLRSAVGYGSKRLTTALLAPAIAMSASLAVGLFLVVAGFVGRIPYFGSVWLVVFSPLFMIAGLMIATFLIATVLGWPLMVAAIATDDCDGFGGLSRAFSGITGKPWPFAAYLALSLLVGSVLALIVSYIGKLSIASSLAFTALGAGGPQTEDALLPSLVHIVTLIQRGIAASFFWTAATVIYLFLRQEVDGLPLDHIASAEEPAPVRDPLPVVGIPATDSILKASSSPDVPPTDHSEPA